MNDSELFNILSRIHVILRREANRITDIEWARVNPEYARAIVQLCAQVPHADLPGLAARMAALMGLEAGGEGRASWSRSAAQEYETERAGTAEGGAHAPRYLSGLR
jgi:hypothetical protein